MESTKQKQILTIDIGGSKVLVATFDQNGTVTDSKKFKTPKEYDAFISQLRMTIVDMMGVNQPMACSIALPGSINRSEGIAEYFGNLPWENVAIAKDLSDILMCPIYLENDAKMAGLAEANSVKDLYHRVLYITVSTGIGLALIENGKIDQDIQDAGGKAIMVEHGGKIMAWEDFASGKAIKEATGKLASEITDEQDWYMIARNLAIGMIDLIVLLNPEVIIIGGGVGSHLPKFHEKLWNELELYHNRMVKMPQIRKAAHPEEAVIYGGYLLAKANLAHRNES